MHSIQFKFITFLDWFIYQPNIWTANSANSATDRPNTYAETARTSPTVPTNTDSNTGASTKTNAKSCTSTPKPKTKRKSKPGDSSSANSTLTPSQTKSTIVPSKSPKKCSPFKSNTSTPPGSSKMNSSTESPSAYCAGHSSCSEKTAKPKSKLSSTSKKNNTFSKTCAIFASTPMATRRSRKNKNRQSKCAKSQTCQWQKKQSNFCERSCNW